MQLCLLPNPTWLTSTKEHNSFAKWFLPYLGGWETGTEKVIGKQRKNVNTENICNAV